MKIVDMRTSALLPYANNPRNNKEAVDYVKKSIEEFGFKVPIVIDRNNVIIAGHTRHKAAMKLGLESVPCIVADDLTPEQVKAFRLADNKVSEVAQWDDNMLSLELLDLSVDFKMGDFGFDFQQMDLKLDGEASSPASVTAPEEEEPLPGYYGDEREKTFNAYRLREFDSDRAEGFYQMPKLKAVQHVPEELIGFNYVLSTDEFHKGVHFYLDDYQFERIWNNPAAYLDRLSQFDCVLTPDFSLYMNMSMSNKIWNIYRSRLIGQIMEDMGMIVIPTLSWAEAETFAFCFDGIEPGGVVSVSTIGVKRDAEAGKIWTVGMKEALRRLRPSTVLVYGGDIGFDFGVTEAVYIDNTNTRDGWVKKEG